MSNEGVRKYPYRCSAGKLTIGIGRNLEDKGLSDSEVMYLFDNDLQDTQDSAESIFEDFSQYTIEEQTVILDMLFNLGATRFKTFKKFIRAIKERDLKEAARQIEQSAYFHQVPNRARRNISLLGG
jgi:lysozyme